MGMSVAFTAASGDAAPVDDAADLGGSVWGGTVQDCVELVLLGRGGVAAKFTF
jgi:hypothetical protein